MTTKPSTASRKPSRAELESQTKALLAKAADRASAAKRSATGKGAPSNEPQPIEWLPVPKFPGAPATLIYVQGLALGLPGGYRAAVTKNPFTVYVLDRADRFFIIAAVNGELKTLANPRPKFVEWARSTHFAGAQLIRT